MRGWISPCFTQFFHPNRYRNSTDLFYPIQESIPGIDYGLVI